jgi:hypothetical protein
LRATAVFLAAGLRGAVLFMSVSWMSVAKTVYTVYPDVR